MLSAFHPIATAKTEVESSHATGRCAACAGVTARGAGVGREFTECSQATASSQIIAGVRLTALASSGSLFLVRSREGAI